MSILWIIELFQWYVWVPIVLVLLYAARRNYRAAPPLADHESSLLILEIPEANDKPGTSCRTVISLHGILRDKAELKLSKGVQEHLSFEIASANGQIRFYVWTLKDLQSFVEGQIYSQYPTVQIHSADEDLCELRAAPPVCSAHNRSHSYWA